MARRGAPGRQFAGRVRPGELGLSPLGPRVRPGRLAAPDRSAVRRDSTGVRAHVSAADAPQTKRPHPAWASTRRRDESGGMRGLFCTYCARKPTGPCRSHTGPLPDQRPRNSVRLGCPRTRRPLTATLYVAVRTDTAASDRVPAPRGQRRMRNKAGRGEPLGRRTLAPRGRIPDWRPQAATCRPVEGSAADSAGGRAVGSTDETSLARPDAPPRRSRRGRKAAQAVPTGLDGAFRLADTPAYVSKTSSDS